MISYKNITIIGTSHISPESIKEVKKQINEIKPDLIALELDKNRLIALLSPKKRKISIKDIKYLGVKGFLINYFGTYVEKKFGDMTGVAPGSEMKEAIMEAKKIKSKIALIDQDVSITIKKLSKIPFKEKLSLLFDSLKQPFKKTKIPFDLRKVPSQKVINQLIDLVKKYPNLYKVLIEERNKYMAKNLYKLMKEYNHIIAIVGAGHEEEIIKEIKNVSANN